MCDAPAGGELPLARILFLSHLQEEVEGEVFFDL
ncbi:hypothetical protein KKC1_12510 [Calderihabitans maritimus]|uniref:Uncharacterized protein n=1 Tax=Calderihabitans maritimus TaxID=1246530 RepID=A0A1Z5HRE0_9FIRM|nr:hypothetical protein KKC1_12510 [Calderihabitans maritimus]